MYLMQLMQLIQLRQLALASPLARRPPNGLPEELLEVGILIGGMAVAGLDIDHARAFVGLGPRYHAVALGFIRGQQRVAFPGDVEPLVGLVVSVEVAQTPRHRMIGLSEPVSLRSSKQADRALRTNRAASSLWQTGPSLL